MLEPHPQVSLDEMLCFPLYAATRAVTRAYADLLGEAGLTYPQYLAMLALWEAEEPLTVGRLGERLLLDSGTLTPVLKRLEAAGHVVRRRDAEDERRVLVEVTAGGRQLGDRLADVPARLTAALGLPLEDVLELRALLHRLLAGLGSPLPVSPGGRAS